MARNRPIRSGKSGWSRSYGCGPGASTAVVPAADRVGAQRRVLEEGVEDVEPEAVDAAVEPAADHLPLGGLDGRRPPVQLGLLDEERVEVELLAARDPLPSPARRRTTPSCSAAAVRRRARAGRVAPQVPVGVRAGPCRREATGTRGAASLVWFITRSRITRIPRCVGRLDEPVEVRLACRTADRPLVVADVVAEVAPGRRVDRRQPDGVDAEAVRPEMVEVVDDPGQVAHPVAVRVGEAPRIDLVDDPALPPVVPEAGLLYDRCEAGGSQAR